MYTLFLIFVGTFFLGEVVAIPVLYFSLLGFFDFWTVFVVMLVATVMYDHIFYFVGRFVPREKLFNLPVVRLARPMMRKVHAFFDVHGQRCVFYSKFVFGTRTAVELLAGIHDMSYFHFARANILAAFVWLLGLSTLAIFIDTSISAIAATAFYAQVGFSVFVLLAVLLLYSIHRYLKRKVFVKTDGEVDSVV